MKLTDVYSTGMRNMGRRKVRTVLTSIGVWVGILTIVTMVSAGIAAQAQITETIRQLGLETVFVSPRYPDQGLGTINPLTTQRPDQPITPASIRSFREMPGVKSVEPVLALPDQIDITLGLEGKFIPLRLQSNDQEDRLFTRPVEYHAGAAPEPSENGRGVVLSERQLREAGFPLAEQIALIGKEATIIVKAARGESTEFKTTVVGINTSPARADLGTADKIDIAKWWYNAPDYLEAEGYSTAIVHTDSLTDASRISNEVVNLGYAGVTLQAFLDQANRIFTILQILLSSIGFLALLVATIGIANTMVMAIYERTREIGVLKALGASEGDIMRTFVVEATGIGLLGGIFGVIGGWLLGILLDWIAHRYLEGESISIPMPFFTVTWWLVLASLLIAALVGLLAGYFPARRAARMDPVMALRHE